MLQGDTGIVLYIIGCGLLTMLAGAMVGYAACRWVTDRKLRRWLNTYGKTAAPQPPKPRSALRYYFG